MRLALVILLMSVGCATTKAAQPKRTLPSPLVAAQLPERPDAEPIPVGKDWSVSIEAGETVPENRAGVLMSTHKAFRAAKYKVAYDELRSLYVVDLRTWGRERDIYDRHLEAADGEIVYWKEKAIRSWFERHAGQIGLGGGIIIGAIVTVAIVYAVDQVKE